jgi:hypothetical protein
VKFVDKSPKLLKLCFDFYYVYGSLSDLDLNIDKKKKQSHNGSMRSVSG